MSRKLKLQKYSLLFWLEKFRLLNILVSWYSVSNHFNLYYEKSAAMLPKERPKVSVLRWRNQDIMQSPPDVWTVASMDRSLRGCALARWIKFFCTTLDHACTRTIALCRISNFWRKSFVSQYSSFDIGLTITLRVRSGRVWHILWSQF